jgi:hypothetical protein
MCIPAFVIWFAFDLCFFVGWMVAVLVQCAVAMPALDADLLVYLT